MSNCMQPLFTWFTIVVFLIKPHVIVYTPLFVLLLLFGRINCYRLSFRVVGPVACFQWHHHTHAVCQDDEQHEEYYQHAPDSDVKESYAVVIVTELVVTNIESLYLEWEIITVIWRL